MNGYSTYRVINTDHIITEPDAEAYQKSGNDTYEESTHGIHGVTACGDADQASQGSVQTHRNIRFAIFYPGEDHTGNSCDSRCNGGSCKDRSQLRAVGCGSTIEAVPAKPEDEAAQGTDDNVMSWNCVRGAVFIVFAKTRALHPGTDQCAEAAYHMDGTGTCEIMEAHLREPAAAPDPVCFNRINNGRNDAGINTVR